MGKCRAKTQTQVCPFAEPVCRVCLQSLFAEPVHFSALAVSLIILLPGTLGIQAHSQPSNLCQGLQLRYFCVLGTEIGRQTEPDGRALSIITRSWD